MYLSDVQLIQRRAATLIAVATSASILGAGVPSRGVSGAAGSCLTQAGPAIAMTAVQRRRFDNTNLAESTKVDASTGQFVTPGNIAIFIGGGPGICFHGGQIIGQLPPSTPYKKMHDTYGMVVHGASFKLEDLQVFDYGDGVSMDANGDATWSVRDVHFKYMRDDCVENDFVNSGSIENSLFDGCYEGFSARPYTRPGHGGFFKWHPTAPMISLYNNVYRADSPNIENDVLVPPPAKLKDCVNNVMIWLGPGPFPERLPTRPGCFQLLTGAAGRQYWDSAVAQWKAQHPSALKDIAPPIVSMWSPSGSRTLTGTVSLTATAVDDQDVAGVQFKLGDRNIGAEVTTEAPITKFTLSWDSRSVPNGAYALTATARDAAGNTTTSAEIAITISN
ncbi:MAG: hypothetical protein DMD69_00120 [Gemmatimonadetes bacterium]|nr:MAG: hypothetical protein DMD69_00120 [Gemmatimonadota bacterium]